MFGFSKAVFDSVISNLKGTSTSMEADSKSYTNQAQKLLGQAETFLSQAQGFLSQAQGFLSHIPNFKWVDVTTTDSKGNETTTQEQQPDPAQDASDKASAAECQQKAEDCKAKAKDCKTNAGVLQALASALLAQVAKLMESILGFTKAGEATNTAITNSTRLLANGATMLGKVISAFNVPEAKNVGDWAKGFGNNLLKNFTGVDLSDGIDTDEVNKIAGIVVDTGATVVSGFTSIVVSSLVASTPIGGTVLASLAAGTVRGGTNFLLNLGRDTAAKVVSKNIVSGLNFIGIKVKEPEKKEDETKVDTDGVNEALEGKKNEMGTLEDATKKNAEEGGNVVGTIASEEVITGNTVQVDDTTEPNPPPEKTEYELAQEQYEKANTEYNNYVNSHKAEKTRVGNSREVYQDEVTRLKNEREKTIQDNLRLSHAANSNIDSGSLKQINNLIEENKKKISEYTEGISKNQALYNEANSKYQKISTEESRLRQQLTNAQTKKNQYNPNK